MTRNKMIAKGGISVLNYYRNSMASMLKSMYPDYPWDPWMFKRLPKDILLGPKVISKALEFAERDVWFAEAVFISFLQPIKHIVSMLKIVTVKI